VIRDPPTHEASAFIHYGETRRRDWSVVRDLGLVKTNFAPWRLGLWAWIQDLHDLAQDLHDRCFMHIQRAVSFSQCNEFPRKLRCAAKVSRILMKARMTKTLI